MNIKQIAIILGMVCFILTIMISIQLKTIKDSTSTVSISFAEDSLRDEILKIKENYDDICKDIEHSELILEKARVTATEEDSSSIKKEEELKKLNNLLGLKEIEGTGVVITLDDNKMASLETISVFDKIENYLVHDGDILEILNELKNAGAEAISVNNQRVVNNTSVLCDGNVVRINEEKVGAPYIINAIGNPEKLYGALTRPEGYLKSLTRYGVITDIKKDNNIKLPKYNGTYKLEFGNSY